MLIDVVTRTRSVLGLEKAHAVIVFDGCTCKPSMSTSIMDAYIDKIYGVRRGLRGTHTSLIVHELWLHKVRGLLLIRLGFQQSQNRIRNKEPVNGSPVVTAMLHSIACMHHVWVAGGRAATGLQAGASHAPRVHLGGRLACGPSNQELADPSVAVELEP